MSEPYLSIRDLRVDYPGLVAVDGLSLDVCAGEACALIGPNGSGKTTTMRAIVGIKQATHGRSTLRGYDIAGDPLPFKRALGYMPDFSPLYDRLTVWEYLDHFARAYRVDGRDKRIAQCLDMVKLSEKAKAMCLGLSRGMQQRLIFARTLLHDPDVYILDEPASGLDPVGRKDLRDIIVDLREQGKAILISSHILTELSAFCNTVAIMEKGKLKFSGTIDQFKSGVEHKPWMVKWRRETPIAGQVLARDEHVSRLKLNTLHASFEYTGSVEKLDELLKQMISEGVAVCEWRPAGDELENLFFASGAKELS